MSKSIYQVYIGTNSVRQSQGIYTVHVDGESLVPRIVSTCPFYNSGALALSEDERFLYAAVEGMTFDGLADGGVVGYETSPEGVLKKRNGRPSHGQRTCCVAVDTAGKSVSACNFYEGTMSIFDVDDNGFMEPARLVIAPPETAGWKALHCVGYIQEKYIGVISLAECALVIYRADNGCRVAEYVFPGQPFPRYFAAYGKYIYAMMQMPDDIYVFESCLENGGGIRLIQKVSVMQDSFIGPKATSTLRVTPDGRLLLAANRPTNSITVFLRMDDGALERSAIVTLPGKVPRDFHISRDGRIVVTALQKSDEICIHEIDYEHGTLRECSKVTGIISPASVAVGRRLFIG